MNLYMKNYGIWLGGSIGVLFLLGLLGVLPYQFAAILDYLAIIGGTIAGTVVTHKALDQNIQFGKAIGPVLMIIGGFALLGLIITIVRWGTDGFSYFLPIFLTTVFMKLIMGTSVLLVTGAWYMFEKAGKPGWAILVPIYNIIVMLEIAEKPIWWIAMFIIPIANIVFLIMMLDSISKKFGKDSGFTVGLVFLRQIFFAILGYGDAVYMGQVELQNEKVIDDF